MDWFSEEPVSGIAESAPVAGDSFVFPVTFAQQRLWFLNRLQPGSSFYNSPWSLRLTGPLDAESLERALGEILRRHEVLRTTFSVQDGEPVQVVAPWDGYKLPVRDLTALVNPVEEARRVAIEYTRQAMDLEKGPLMRAELLHIGANDHVLLILIHHILFDGWSRRVLSGELADLYNAFSQGEPSPLPELTLQYGDFSVWQRKFLSGKTMQAQLDYWKRQLDDAPPVLDLPADRPRPAIAAYRGARFVTKLNLPLLDRLREISRAENATLFMTLLAVFGIVLSRHTNQEDLVIGTPVAGRNRVQIEKLIGLFVNSLALRMDLSGDPGFRTLLQRVRETTLGAYANQDLPFERLVEELRVERDLSRNPVFQVMLILQNIPGKANRLNGITSAVFTDGAETSKMDLMLFAIERIDGLDLTFEYNTDLFDESTIARLTGHLRNVLEAVAANPELPVGQYEILSPEERTELLVRFNDTKVAWPEQSNLHQLIEEQAARTPDSLALISGANLLTYGDLNSHANQLARLLAARGVNAETLVAICLNRTPEMLIGLLAILKAGGAYVPLDPEFPVDRLSHILEDSGANLVLTSEALLSSLPAHAGQMLLLESVQDEIASQPDSNLPPVAAPRNTAYILFTSGSTGKPKGVRISHSNVVNFLTSMQRQPGIAEDDTLLAVTTLSFDIAGLELFLPLITGARVVLASRDQARDAGELIELMNRWSVTILQATPVTWWMLLEAGWSGNQKLKALCGGEALPSDLASRLVDRCGELWNMYGPTETTIWSSVYKVEEKPVGVVPIGRPIANTSLYVLDSRNRPQPIGVSGELYIGGDGVGIGYWNRPELTAEKFVDDPYCPGTRMYRTGDLAKFLPDGNVQFLSRADFQVKLRGFRIELGEIEAVLDRHPLVTQSVVLLREDQLRSPRLVAYIVPRAESESSADAASLAREQVSQWAMTWDASYVEGGDVQDASLNLSGWNSSYTGEPIPRDEMRRWADATVERIQSLHPRKIWEIGCGTGLLLFRLAPKVERYHGTDVAPASITFLERQLARPDFKLPHVSLTQRAAHEPGPGAVEDRFDLVVLNSVVQYFPNIDYLVEVLTGAVDAVGEGSVFVGDVRNFQLLKEFHTSVEWFRAADSMSREDFLRRARLQTEQEGELAISPEFFLALPAKFPRIQRVEIQVKRGREQNEMSRFRYDVILHIGKPPVSPPTPAPLDWTELDLNVERVRELLSKTQPEVLVLARVPDGRVMPDVQLTRMVAKDDAASTVGELRTRFDSTPSAAAPEPEELWALEREFPYLLEMRPSLQANGYLDVMFLRRGPDSHFEENRNARFPSPPAASQSWNLYANNPLRQRLVEAITPQVREWLTGKVPEYMVPSAFVLMDAIPLSLNGKVNRRALPAPELDLQAVAAYVEPETDTQKEIAAIWAEVLRVARVGLKDNFFALGGHSLLAAQVISRLKQRFRVELPLRTIFETPALGEMSSRIDSLLGQNAAPAETALKPLPRPGRIPLSFTQQRLWFLDQMDPLNPAYNLGYGVRFSGPLHAAALEEAINGVLQRHEALRTRFEAIEGEPAQVIEPWSRFTLPVTDLGHLEPEERERRVREQAKAEAHRPFQLSTGPLFRAHLFRLSDHDHVFVTACHHIVSDGWSVGVLRDELQALYRATLTGEPACLAELPVQYADYAVWQRSSLSAAQFDAQLDYWKTNLAGIPALLDLPTDRPRPAIRTFAGATRSAVLPIALLESLRQLSLREGATLYMTLLSGFSVLLARYSRQDDIVIGSPIAGRRHVEIESLIGFFVNTLVLRTDVSGDLSFRDLLRRVRDTSLKAEANQDIPFEKLVEELQVERNRGNQPLFQVLFALQNVPAGARKWHELAAESFSLKNEQAKFDISLFAAETPAGLRLSLEYSTDIFDDTTIARLLNHFEVLLTGVVNRPDTPVDRLPLLTATEETQQLTEWNQTGVHYPAWEPIPLLFERQAAQTPEAVALVFEGHELTYAELNARANQLAHHLRSLSVRPETLVGICVERSLEMLVGILGILKAGGAYVPIDPLYPPERRAFMLEDAQAPVLLTQAGLAASLHAPNAVTICLDTEWDKVALQPQTNPEPLVRPENVAYVIYTSGSTGKPKGVLVTHANVARLFTATDHWFSFGPADTWTLFHSFAFDFSVWEIWGALLYGGRLVIVPRRIAQSPEEFHQLLIENRVTVLNQTPSAFRQLIVADEKSGRHEQLSLRTVIFGGEALDFQTLLPWVKLHGDKPELINMYGITETTVHVTWHKVPSPLTHETPSLMGVPIPDLQVYVLDRHLRPVPAGIAGELFVGGDGLARGYLNRPELTAERFIPDPFNKEPGARLYKTGDLARFRANGDMEYLGRADQQVKLRGFRIELGEIESVLASHDTVRQSLVLLREDPVSGPRLVAWLVPTPGRTIDPSALREHGRCSLPDYMIPSAFVELPAFPLTPNGKVDQKALPEPKHEHVETVTSRAATPAEEIVMAIWAEVLRIDEIGVDEDFFDLGGHSLLATQVVARVSSALAVEVPLRILFEAPTVRGFTAELDKLSRVGKTSGMPPLARVDRRLPLPLSFAQQRFWLLNQLNPGDAGYDVKTAMRIVGALDASILQTSLTELVARHEVLRTTYRLSDAMPVQIIHPPSPVVLEVVDLEGVSQEDATRRATAATPPFDLATGPVCRFQLYRLAPEQFIFVVSIHHIAMDGTSSALLFQDLATLYSQISAGDAPHLPALPFDYADFAVGKRDWMQGQVLDDHLAYWRKQLEGLPPQLSLPADNKVAQPSSAGSLRSMTMAPEFTGRLTQLCREQKVTGFGVMLASLSSVLHSWTSEKSFAIGTVTGNRPHAELERTVGCFLNMLPLRMDVNGSERAVDLLARAKSTVLDGFVYGECPFESIVEAMQVERAPNRNPIFNVGLLMQTFSEVTFKTDSFEGAPIGFARKSALLDLRFVVSVRDGLVRLACEYKTDLFQPETIDLLLQAFGGSLDAIVQDPSIQVEAIPFPTALRLQAENAETDRTQQLVLSATFTAEPLEEPLRFWIDALELRYDVAFAPYNQIFQTLLDPGSIMRRNDKGSNVLLIRFEDWQHFEEQFAQPARDRIARNTEELISAVKAAAAGSAATWIICCCPASRALASDPAWAEFQLEIENTLVRELETTGTAKVITPGQLAELYPVSEYEDKQANTLAHVPYTKEFSVSLATMIIRRLSSVSRPPYKVIALDCDNTLWNGICGEEGALGVTVDAPRRALQSFMKKQSEQGMLLCLCSKNNENDVWEVFDKNPGMLLKREDIAGHRINWRRKPGGLRELSEELGLGLDSFVFVDDNPVECAEMEAECPQVLTLELPENVAEIPHFLQHVWAFDHFNSTDVDRQRSRMYRESRQREELREGQTLDQFIESLQIEITISAMSEHDVVRVAQLTQRTNQFNVTTIRRTETEVRDLLQSPTMKCHVVNLRDRFGDYGLVGAVIYSFDTTALRVETLLLSCRALGRRVEHAILNRLFDEARSHGLNHVDIDFSPTSRNAPALEFLESMKGAATSTENGGATYRFSATNAL